MDAIMADNNPELFSTPTDKKNGTAYKRNSFVFYRDWYDMICQLDDKTAIDICKAIMASAFEEQYESKETITSTLILAINPQIKRDKDKWNEIRLKRSEAGKKHRGNQYSKMEQNETNGTSETSVPITEQTEQDGTNGTVNVDVDVDVDVSKDTNVSMLDKEINNNPAENEFQQGREELIRQIEELKAQNEELKREKKTKAKPIPKTLGGKAQALFIEYYKERGFSDQDYYWEAKDGSAMKKILDKIISARNGKGLPCDNESILQALKSLLESVTDDWILQHFNPSVINSKYNDIVAMAKKDYAVKRETRLISYAVSLGLEREAKIYGIDLNWFKDADEKARETARKGNLARIENYMREHGQG